MRFKLAALVGLAWLILPVQALAHGGVQQNTDNAIVTLYQTPLSPVVCEKVTTDFVIKSKDGDRLKNMPVKLSLTDTYYGDSTKDKMVLTQNLRTDANGLLAFSYRYAKPDYYDIDLDFKVDGKSQESGFLIQVRNPYKNWYSLTYVAVLGVGLGLGCWLARSRK